MVDNPPKIIPGSRRLTDTQEPSFFDVRELELTHSLCPLSGRLVYLSSNEGQLHVVDFLTMAADGPD